MPGKQEVLPNMVPQYTHAKLNFLGLFVPSLIDLTQISSAFLVLQEFRNQMSP